MGLISNGTTLLDAGALDSGVAKGALTHIKTITASSDSTINFVHGSSSVVLDNTYSEYIFKFINIHPSDGNMLTINGRDGGTDYDATKTSTFVETYLNENGTNTPSVEHVDDYDLAQSTAAQRLAYIGNENDESSSGYLHLYNPSSTTYVKHFISRFSCYHGSNLALDAFVQGYFNVTAAIDGIQFAMVSGNIDSGTIKLYGVS